MRVLIDIPEQDYELACNYPTVLFGSYAQFIKKGTIIPDNATNGDVVEKIFGKDVYCTLIRMMYSSCCEKLKNWWNAPYKKSED